MVMMSCNVGAVRREEKECELHKARAMVPWGCPKTQLNHGISISSRLTP